MWTGRQRNRQTSDTIAPSWLKYGCARACTACFAPAFAQAAPAADAVPDDDRGTAVSLTPALDRATRLFVQVQSQWVGLTAAIYTQRLSAAHSV